MNIRQLQALRVVCGDYHSGQCSRGYRLGSMAYRALKRRGAERFAWDSVGETAEYQAMVRAWGEKL